MIITSRTYKTKKHLFHRNVKSIIGSAAKNKHTLCNNDYYIENDKKLTAKTFDYLNVDHMHVLISHKNDECIVTCHTIILTKSDMDDKPILDNAIDQCNKKINNGSLISDAVDCLKFSTI